MQAAVAAAVSSGAQRLEAAAVVTEATALDNESAAVLANLGVTAAITADAAGTVRS
jgi:hypothetical protein